MWGIQCLEGVNKLVQEWHYLVLPVKIWASTLWLMSGVIQVEKVHQEVKPPTGHDGAKGLIVERELSVPMRSLRCNMVM